MNFEVTLKENGQILTQYNNVGAFGRQQGDSATIGIENATGTDALQFSFNEASITPPNHGDSVPAAPLRVRPGPRDGRQRPPGTRRRDREGAAGRQRRTAGHDRRGRLLPDAGAGRELHDRSQQDELRDRLGRQRHGRRGRDGDEGLRAPYATRRGESDVTRVDRAAQPDPHQDAHARATPAAWR